MEAPHARSARTSPCSCAERHRPVAHQRVNCIEPRNGRPNRRGAVRRSARRCLRPLVCAHICTCGRCLSGGGTGSGRRLSAAHRRSAAIAARAGPEVPVRRLLDFCRQPGEALHRARKSRRTRDDTSIGVGRRGRTDPHEHRSRHGGRGGVGVRIRRTATAPSRGRRTGLDVQHPGRALFHPARWITRWHRR